MSAIEDEISTADTEDALLKGSRNSSETISEGTSKRPWCYVIGGGVLLVWGLATLIWTPFEILMAERLRMTPGFPPYEWWKNPPDEVIIRAYLYNVTNSEEFLNNPNVKINMAEIGPIVFMEKLTHTNVTFNENGTMTYVATRKAIFLPELNSIDLNATIVVPNWALLGIASYLSEQSFFVKLGFNLLTRSVKPQQFVKLTIDQFLWNFTDPMLDAAYKIAPFLVPIKNLGILSRIYTNFTNTVTVYIGTKYGDENFFLIDKYDGSKDLPNYGASCGGGVVNSSEGVAYPQYITKNTTLKYWRKTFCKMAVLHHRKDVSKYGVNAFRFDLIDSIFNRTEPSEADCFRGQPDLPDGLSDISKCHFGFPLATSFPHFLHGDSIIRSYVSGMKPNRTKHSSYLIVEPTTGVPLESAARSQSNLVVRKLTGFNELVTPFSDTVIPMFWLEYNQMGLPWYIIGLVYFQVNVLPIFQRFFTAFLLTGSVILFCFYIKHKRKQRLLDNKVLVFEKELFMKKP
ncbi:scavenger receptor class B member 1 [Tribolium castaneum]|uniref:Protein croquemort-like Protein n=1 Tax=Tribolium castaneum TaxID=7070 RepID=D2A5M8_TRICA|nr:PREDICTED: scavenger receptor class B member 1 [Tribolium castaneum]XP_015836305.1 PREDICTED: scavenger receptor class B member 1 [Tribolium castaneum]EFA05690.2 Protein croquemort-like Protein [Tribolium castaneum]|eukprot:XP_015836304.1 PREDICTED: scavenger receptor class B member 1 [Tribolium castaneum]